MPIESQLTSGIDWVCDWGSLVTHQLVSSALDAFTYSPFGLKVNYINIQQGQRCLIDSFTETLLFYRHPHITSFGDYSMDYLVETVYPLYS